MQIIESKIKELEGFTKALTKSALVVRTDIKGNVVYINDKFCKTSGYTQEDLIGKNMGILKAGNRPKSFYKRLWNTINNKDSYTTLFENKAKDGNAFYLETTINPILNTAGEIVEFVGVSHDVTDLIQSNKMIKKAEKSKEDFFTNISHEMKTPLNSILGFSALLMKRLKDDEKSSMMLNTILETGEDLKNLVESIVDMRKIRENTLELNLSEFNPHKDLRKYLQKYENVALEKGIIFDIVVEKSLPDILTGDLIRISQLIGIFIDNGIKFSKESGKVHVSILYDHFEKLMICEIKDDGIGIAKEDQTRIFKLEQLDGNSTRSYEGAGIGLSIAAGLVKAMNGKISLKSILGRGSLFTIEIPIY